MSLSLVPPVPVAMSPTRRHGNPTPTNPATVALYKGALEASTTRTEAYGRIPDPKPAFATFSAWVNKTFGADAYRGRGRRQGRMPGSTNKPKAAPPPVEPARASNVRLVDRAILAIDAAVRAFEKDQPKDEPDAMWCIGRIRGILDQLGPF